MRRPPDSEDRGQPKSLGRQPRVPNGVDTPVHAMEARGCHARVDHLLGQAEGTQLIDREDPVLHLGDLNDPRIECVDFPPHFEGVSRHTRTFAPAVAARLSPCCGF